MDFTKINEVFEGRIKEGQAIKVRGWIYRTRSQGNLSFVVVRDYTGVMQCAVRKGAVSDEECKAAEKALIESAVVVEGAVKKDARAPGGFELQASKFEVLHYSEVFPISRDQSTEFLLDVRHLWLRSRELTAAMQVKASVLEGARLFFKQENVFETTPPIFVSSACEGGSTLFELDYFGQKASLTQSAQLHLEALIFALEKVYSITPSFRAEKSRTTKHLTEYWHIEGEFGFEELLDFVERQVKFIAHYVARERPNELKLLGRDPNELLAIKAPFARMTYDEAVADLQKKGNPIKYGEDFGADEEMLLTKDLTQPVFITHFPKEIKAFYMKESGDGKTVKAADLLAPQGFGELVGGSERETDVDVLIQKLEAQGQDVKNYAWYLDLRRYGSVQHSGYGLGCERLTRWFAKLDHIRDTMPFPRVINRVYP